MRIWNRIRYLLNRRRHERELDDELRIHEEMLEENLRTAGQPAADARRMMGNVTRALETSRAQWNFPWLESLLLDVRYAVRSFSRTPMFALTVIGTIGLALGLNTALFTVFNAYVLRPLAVRDPYNLYQFVYRTKEGNRVNSTFQEYEDLRRQNTVLSDVFVYQSFIQVASLGILVEPVSGNFFMVLGVRPALGRTLIPEDTTASGGQAVLVLSHQAWKKKFAADPNILGRDIIIRGIPFRVVGVTGPEFAGVTEAPPDAWMPFSMSRQLGLDPWLNVMVRLRPKVTVEQAEAALSVFVHQQFADRPEEERAAGALLLSRATRIRVDRDLMLIVLPSFVLFGLVLVIAGANVASMMLARAIARQREMAIRLSLGAGRYRLVRQLLTESLSLAVPGAVAGFFISQMAVRAAQQLIFATLPRFFARMMNLPPLEPDIRVFAFILFAAVTATLVFGLVPALQITRPGLVAASRGDFSHNFGPSRLRSALVVSQVTVCVLLLITAGVIVRTGRRVETQDLGLEPRGVININIGDKFRKKVIEQLAAEPVVETLAAAASPPLYGAFSYLRVASGEHTDVGWERANFVSPEYFRLFRIPLVSGRNFTAQEAYAEAAVVIISRATARRFWPDENAVGKTIRIIHNSDIRWRVPAYSAAQVIGVSRDVISGLVFEGMDSSCLYFPTNLYAPKNEALLVRLKGQPEVALRTLNTSLEAVAPGGAEWIHPLQELVATELYPFHISFWISSFLGGIALVLTISGIYGVMSYLVSQRTKEIGIRVALGATTRDVIAIVLAQSVKMSAIGGAVGVILAAGACWFAASALEMIKPFDVAAYSAGLALVVAATAAASFFPSRRAAQIDPSTTLRFE